MPEAMAERNLSIRLSVVDCGKRNTGVLLFAHLFSENSPNSLPDAALLCITPSARTRMTALAAALKLIFASASRPSAPAEKLGGGLTAWG